MKKLILLMAMLVSCAVLYARDCYIVDVRVLNVRSAPSLTASVIGSLQKDATVYTETSPSDGWLKISYKNGYGYVSADYVKYSHTVQEKHNKKKDKFKSLSDDFMQFVSRASESVSLPYVNDVLLLAIAVIALAVTFFVGCNSARRHWFLCMVSFLTASCATLYLVAVYVVYGTSMMLDGWLWYVVAFFGVALVTYGYLMSALTVMYGIDDAHCTAVNWMWGWVPWLIAAALIVVDTIFSIGILGIILGVLAAYQIGFCIYIVVEYFREGEYLVALPVVILYVLSSLAATVVITCLVVSVVVIALCVLAIMFVLGALASGGSGSSRGSSSDGYDYETSKGDKLREVGSNRYEDEYGHRWSGDGWGKVWRDD